MELRRGGDLGDTEESSKVDGERGVQGAGLLPGQGLTFGPLDAGVLIVAEEEAFSAVALIAAHHVDTALLTAPIALGTLVHICAGERLVSSWVQPPNGGRSLKSSAHTPPPPPQSNTQPQATQFSPLSSCSTPEEATLRGQSWGVSTWGGTCEHGSLR